jgi:hypothetical protein
MQTLRIAITALLLTIPAVALAGPNASVPEPETLALLGIGAIALVAARWRKRK